LYRSGLHQYASELKPSVQQTFNSIVDFTIDVETRLLKDKKQDLLGDIHTQLTNAITSEMLTEQLLPTYKFRSQFIIDEMMRRHRPNYVTVTDEHPMKVRSELREAQMRKLSKILERMDERFDIRIPVILEMLNQKRKRNDGKHYDSRIQAHINTHQGRSRQFRTFIASQGFLRAFDDTEISQTQRMYVDHCRYSAVEWHKR
jgi:hypothetical protein